MLEKGQSFIKWYWEHKKVLQLDDKFEDILHFKKMSMTKIPKQFEVQGNYLCNMPVAYISFQMLFLPAHD